MNQKVLLVAAAGAILAISYWKGKQDGRLEAKYAFAKSLAKVATAPEKSSSDKP